MLFGEPRAIKDWWMLRDHLGGVLKAFSKPTNKGHAIETRILALIEAP